MGEIGSESAKGGESRKDSPSPDFAEEERRQKEIRERTDAAREAAERAADPLRAALRKRLAEFEDQIENLSREREAEQAPRRPRMGR